MKPPAFEYLRPDSVEETLSLLASRGTDAKILAGGQSLVPMLNFRLSSPRVLLDINRIDDLDAVESTKRGLRIGALARHRSIETSPVVSERLPILSAAARWIGHLAIRNRGTLGGSLAHADPAAEWPLLCVLLDAQIHTRGPAGERALPARDFFVSYMTTALDEAELVTQVEIPALAPGAGWSFEEFARRRGDFALASAGVTLRRHGDAVREPKIALGGVGLTALRASEAEALLDGATLDEELLARVGEAARDASDPTGDIHASADFRRHLVDVLTRRAVRDAWERVEH
jgi:CO/xanthine dehydrogenase FAD-binding subunit